ncbi:MAG: sortase [Anaerolineae bacterium]|jgi:LPXTG-site transpeptidase (sortase) family protein
MTPKKTSIFAAVLPLAIVICVSLTIVGGIVTWMASREGVDLGELGTELLIGRQAAPAGVAQVTRMPTPTPYPSPTPILIAAAPTQARTAEAAPTLPPTEPPAANTPSQFITSAPSPTAMAEPQIEQAIESPIRPNSTLPERPATRLVIPAMELDVPVIVSPIVNQTWKVDELGKDFVGHLEGTASPGDPSNVVLAGHVTIASNVYGPFAGLGKLKAGDSIILYTDNQSYTYIVDYRQLVDRTDIHVAYPSDTGRVTLITCSNWSDELGAYQKRLIVVGHLESAGS